jgi:hypothetical protein
MPHYAGNALKRKQRPLAPCRLCGFNVDDDGVLQQALLPRDLLEGR